MSPISENYCYPVTNIMLTETTSNSATFTWEYTETTTFLYELKTRDAEWTDDEVISGMLNNTTLTISDLLPSTPYVFRVKVLCSSDESIWRQINFNTACAETVTDYPHIQNFDAGHLYCWTNMIYQGTEDHITSPALESYEGGYVCRFNQGYTMIALTSLFDEPINNLRVRYETLSQGYYGADSISLGYVTDLSDTSTFVAISDFQITQPNTWLEKIVDFNNVEYENNLNYYIAFKAKGGAYTNLYLDNIEISQIPECPAPERNSVTAAPTSSSATITWVDNDTTHTAWIIHYREAESEDEWETEEATQIPYTLEGLTPTTNYELYIITDCGNGDDTDRTNTITFRTTAEPVELPFYQNFDNTTGNIGITFTQNNSNKWYIGNAIAYDSTGNSMYISSNNGDSNIYTNSTSTAIASIIVNFEEAGDYIFSFDYKSKGEGGYYYYDYLRVYALDASLPVSQYEEGEALTEKIVNQITWSHADILLPQEFVGTTKNLIFVWTNDASTNYNPPAAIDNISIRKTECGRPTNLAVTEETESSATLTWTGEADSYIINYQSQSDTENPQTITSTTNTVTLTNLTHSTDYTFTVIAVCDEDTSFVSDYQTFTTLCTPVTDDVWFEDFESALGSQSNANALFRCWNVLNSFTANNGTFPMIYYQGYAPAAHSGSVSLEFKGSGMLALPEFVHDLNTLRLTFYMTTTSSTIEGAGTMEIGYLTNPEDSTTFVALTTVTPVGLSRSESIMVGPFDFDQIQQTEGRIALRYTPVDNGTSWNLDDFTVKPIPSCPSPIPTSVVISAVTDEQATISWTDNDATHTAWTVHYKTDAETQYNQVQATSQTITLTGLNSSTQYSVYVKTDCGDTNNLDRTDIFTFVTLAEPITEFPYYQDFEDLAYNPSHLEFRNASANKWIVGSSVGVNDTGDSSATTHSLYISNNNQDNTYSLYNLSYASAVMPIRFEDASEYVLEFDYKVVGESNYDFFMLFICDSNVTIPTNSQPSGEGVTTLMDKTSMVYDWTRASIPLSGVANTTKQIVFYWKNDTSGGIQPPIAIDNISIESSNCGRPTELAVTTITANETVLTWASSIDALEWVVYYKSSDETEYTSVTASENTITLTNLDAITEYTAYVVAECFYGTSEPSTSIEFTTACNTISTFPYFESFEGETQCWSRELLSGYNNWYQSAYISGGSAYEGQKMMKVDYTSGSARLISPIFDITGLQTPHLKLAYQNPPYASYIEELRIQYRASQDAEWTDLKTITEAHSNWVLDSIFLPNASDSYQFAVLVVGHNGDGAAVDAIQVYDTYGSMGELPCDAPINLIASNITQTTADITWNGTADTYEFKLNGGESETLTATSKSLTELTANTTYTVEVRAICGEQQSTWATTTFTTLEEIVEPDPCDAPTNLVANNITETTADIAWEGTAETYEFKLNGGEAETLTATTKALTDLTANTTYTVEVRAICGEQQSTWTTTTFTTLEEQVVVVLGEVTTTPATEVGNTSATLNGALVSTGNSENYTLGFALATVADFTLETEGVQNITATATDATFSQAVNDLVEGQTYFYRAYITNEAGTAYGSVETFTLSSLADAMSNALQVSVYPNPANTQATLRIEGLQSDSKIVISDIQGRILSQDQISAGTSQYTLDLSNMASGVYYIRIVTDEAISTQKLIVE